MTTALPCRTRSPDREKDWSKDPLNELTGFAIEVGRLRRTDAGQEKRAERICGRHTTYDRTIQFYLPQPYRQWLARLAARRQLIVGVSPHRLLMLVREFFRADLELQRGGKKVATAGDVVNNAPALAQAKSRLR